MGTGHAKGAQFERDICQRLSLWVSGMTREDCFWRSAMSGGRATLRTRRHRHLGEQTSKAIRRRLDAQVGDVTATHQYGMPLLHNFLVECKFYKRFDFRGMIYNAGEGLVGKWWKEARKQGRSCDPRKAPMMVIKCNHADVLVCTNNHGLRLLDPTGEKMKIHATFPQYRMHVLLFREMIMVDYREHVLPQLAIDLEPPVVRHRR